VEALVNILCKKRLVKICKKTKCLIRKRQEQGLRNLKNQDFTKVRNLKNQDFTKVND
jgi:hypothetical protein